MLGLRGESSNGAHWVLSGFMSEDKPTKPTHPSVAVDWVTLDVAYVRLGLGFRVYIWQLINGPVPKVAIMETIPPTFVLQTTPKSSLNSFPKGSFDQPPYDFFLSKPSPPLRASAASLHEPSCSTWFRVFFWRGAASEQLLGE